MNKGIKYVVPYAIAIMGMWLVLLVLWYLVGLPLGLAQVQYYKMMKIIFFIDKK